MREGLDELAIDGRIVVGSEDSEDVLSIGPGGRGGMEVDLAVDPLEGRSVVARRLRRDGDDRRRRRGSFPEPAPDVHAQDGRRAGGQGEDRPPTPVGDNVRAIAEAFGRNTNDITAIVLDRPRHHDLIEEIRAAGARIKLIQDGDVTASITSAIRGTNDHLAIGIGGLGRRFCPQPPSAAWVESFKLSSGRPPAGRSRPPASTGSRT